MNILLIDDVEMVSEVISDFLSLQLGHQVTTCRSAEEARRIYSEQCFPLIISDICMPGMDGLDVVSEIKRIWGKRSEVILITGHAKLETALQALRLGAYDYLPKPIEIDRLANHIDAIESNLQSKTETELMQTPAKTVTQQLLEIPQIGTVSFTSTVMLDRVEQALKLHKDRRIPVVLEGETGTGKEIFARLIHYGKEKQKLPFISINCSAISPQLFESELFGYVAGSFTGANKQGKLGKFELARGGTLFLDEIGELPLEMQPKLLKALEDKEIYRVGGISAISVDVRVICASNKNLTKMAEAGEFRKDLLYRINTAKMTLPPLRERKNDILELSKLFIERYCLLRNESIRHLTPEAELLLLSYAWPGNVRQLRNTLERVMITYDYPEIKAEFLDFLDNEEAPAKDSADEWIFSLPMPRYAFNLYEVEEKICHKALSLHDGNKTKTAAYLGISINKLRRILKIM